MDRLEKIVESQGQEIKELSLMVQRLAYEQQRMRDALSNQAEREANEREKLLLRLENRLLKEKLQLPPQTTKSKADEDNEK